MGALWELTKLELQELLDQITREYRAVLGRKLCGLYLHGSATLGGFHPGRSDLDFLAVVERPPHICEKLRLLGFLCALSPQGPKKGIEMSVVLASVCQRPVLDMPFELHYSPMWRELCESDPLRLCITVGRTDPDLPAHFRVARERGKALFGPPPDEIFAPVPDGLYRESVYLDLRASREELGGDAASVLLNLCRTLAFEREGLLLSKAGGGEWALNNLGLRDPAPLRRALDCCIGGLPMEADSACEQLCGELMGLLGIE